MSSDVGAAVFNPQTLASPYALWARLRAQAPLQRIDIPGIQRPVYLVARRADVQQVAGDPQTYASVVPSEVWRWGDLGPVLQPHLLAQGWPIVHTIASADPPLHARYRKLVGPMFLPSKVKLLVSKLQASIDELLQQLPRGERFDFMDKFAVPLPIMMISDMLGLPREDRERVRRYTDTFVRMVDPSTPPDEASQAVTLFAEGQHYMARRIERLEREPDDSVMSDVANARDDDGQPFSMEERLSLGYMLMAAGNETTRNALSLSAYYLATQPELWQALKSDREKVGQFIDEALRVGTPAVLNPRFVTRDTELAGEPIAAGAIVFMLWGSANRDESTFADADQIRLERTNTRSHMAFGFGIHSCVGAPLARQELNLSVHSWLNAFDSMALAVPREVVQHAPLFAFRTFPELPLIVR
ncbi:MAG: cytochrome P450 [Steroidobacteraceae bacterium]